MPADRVTTRAWQVLRRVVLAADTDPRAVQSGLAVLVVVDGLMRRLGGLHYGVSWPAAAALLVLVLTALTYVARGRLSPAAMQALLVADIGAIGLGRLHADGGSGLLVVVPALWLGRLFGRRGALVTAVATVLLLTVPALVHSGVEGMNLSRSVMLPVVATIAALAIAGGMDQVGRVTETLDHQRRVNEATLETVDVGLALLDRDGRYQGMNRRHGDFMALADPGGPGDPAGRLTHMYGADGVTLLQREEVPTYRAASGQEFDDCRIWVGDDPLTQRALSVSARSVRDEHGHFDGAALAYNDVTDLVRAIQVKEEFVASVSHELRTPLTSIVGYLQMLLERDDLDRLATRQLEVVDRNAQRLLRLISDLLETAQVETGGMVMTRGACDLAEIVRHCVHGARPAYRAARIRLDVEAPERLPMRLDRHRIEQVVDNLLTNALKYSRPDSEVCVRLGQVDGRAELSVCDQGIGISGADRDRLFTRFFRAGAVKESPIPGVGLGLSITREIVEAHGGRIEVESEVGVGSTFRVRLPMA